MQVFRAKQHAWATRSSRFRHALELAEALDVAALSRARAALSEVRESPTPSAKLRHMQEALAAVDPEPSSAAFVGAPATEQPAAAARLDGMPAHLRLLARALLTSEVRAPHAELRFVIEYAQQELDVVGPSGRALGCLQVALDAIAALEIDEPQTHPQQATTNAAPAPAPPSRLLSPVPLARPTREFHCVHEIRKSAAEFWSYRLDLGFDELIAEVRAEPSCHFPARSGCSTAHPLTSQITASTRFDRPTGSLYASSGWKISLMRCAAPRWGVRSCSK